MESLALLSAPLKQFASCMSGKKTTAKKRGDKRGQSVRRRSFTRRRRSLPCSSQKVPDSWLRMYQAELRRERQRQQAMLAKKNAERSVRKPHFRSHHCLPRTTPARRPAPATDDSFFGAFRGLSLDGLTGDGHRSASLTAPAAAAAAGGDQCKVM